MVICPSRLKCSPRSACVATPPLGLGRNLMDTRRSIEQYTVIGSAGSSTTAASPNMSFLGSQGSSVSVSSNLSTVSWATSTQATHDLNSQLKMPVISRDESHMVGAGKPALTKSLTAGNLPMTHEAYLWLFNGVALPMMRRPGEYGKAYKAFLEANSLHFQIHGRPSGEALYNLACCLSLGSSAVAHSEMSEARLDLGVGLLMKSLEAGYDELENMLVDEDIKELRDKRPIQFQQIVRWCRARAAARKQRMGKDPNKVPPPVRKSNPTRHPHSSSLSQPPPIARCCSPPLRHNGRLCQITQQWSSRMGQQLRSPRAPPLANLLSQTSPPSLQRQASYNPPTRRPCVV